MHDRPNGAELAQRSQESVCYGCNLLPQLLPQDAWGGSAQRRVHPCGEAQAQQRCVKPRQDTCPPQLNPARKSIPHPRHALRGKAHRPAIRGFCNACSGGGMRSVGGTVCFMTGVTCVTAHIYRCAAPRAQRLFTRGVGSGRAPSWDAVSRGRGIRRVCSRARLEAPIVCGRQC